MANICSNFISITGDEAQLEALSKRLEEQDPELLKIVPNFTICPTSDYCINDPEDINNNSNEISFYFGSKSICPLNSIRNLSEQYPDLEFQLNFEEAAMEYFGTATIHDGGCSETEMEEIDYVEQHNDEYIGLLALLEACSYEEFLKEYTHGNFFEDYPFGYLDRHVVKRIEDKDLAKFINRQWFDDEAEKEYKSRLSGGSTKEPKTKD